MAKKAKNNGKTIAVERNEFSVLAHEFVTGQQAALTAFEKQSQGQMATLLRMAELTSNDPVKVQACRDALNAEYKTKGIAVATARVYVSEAMRVIKAYYIKDKKSKKMGREILKDVGYLRGKMMASEIIAKAGKKDPRGQGNAAAKRKAAKAAAPLDKAAVVDTLDKLINTVTVTAGYKPEVKAMLLKLKDMIKKTKVQGIIVPTMSVGQKAAATRRANQAARAAGATVH